MGRSKLFCVVIAGCLGGIGGCLNASPEPSTSDEDLRVHVGSGEFAKSGSRLTARFVRARRGPEVFHAFHDRALGVDCTFAVNPDGLWQCMPTTTGDVLFADASCSAPLLRDNGSVPEYVRVEVTVPTLCDASAGRYRAYAVGDAVTPATTYWRSWDGSCQAQPTEETFRSLEAVADADLVSAIAGVRFAGGYRLFENVLFGSDGSRSHIGEGSYRDLWRWSDVDRLYTRRGASTDGDVVWARDARVEARHWTMAPPNFNRPDLISYFTDESCTNPTAIGIDSSGRSSLCEGEGRLGLNGPELDTASCEWIYDYFHVNGTATTIGSRQGTDGVCHTTGPIPAYEVGDALAAREFVEGTVVRTGRGRITRVEIVNDDHSRVPVGLYDEEFGAPCTPTTLADGSHVCEPPSSPLETVFGTISTEFYSDPTCTTRVAVRNPMPYSRAGMVGIPNPRDFRVENQACFDGPLQVFSRNEAGELVRAVAGEQIGDGPIPIYQGFGRRDGSIFCVPRTISTEVAYEFVEETVEAASLDLVTR